MGIEGPGDEVENEHKLPFSGFDSRKFPVTKLVNKLFSGFLEKRAALRGKPKFLTGNSRSI